MHALGDETEAYRREVARRMVPDLGGMLGAWAQAVGYAAKGVDLSDLFGRLPSCRD